MTLSNCFSQAIIPLWEGVPPRNIEHEIKEIREVSPWGGAKILSGVSEPELWFFKSKSDAECPAIIICPGGGYAKEAYEHEGTQVAEWLSQQGLHAFVLKYRLPNARICSRPTYVPLMDAQRAVQLVKELSGDYKIQVNQVGIMGFSAGGHLAASCSNLFEPVDIALGTDPIKPDFSILLYPVISMKSELTHGGSRNNLLGKSPSKELIKQFSLEQQTSAQTPPTFICHAKDDEAVSIQNSKVYAESLNKYGVHHTFHILSEGGHGFGMRDDSPAFIWTSYLEEWLRANVLSK
ncbi:alpha/beta hydrolase [Carboxylicivirga sp. M1479]|uniref:alpha/beta hydrolase n=1 Tax=Carboxylicivirga sp. M1479 TaxID=2594476 RepID=UPI001177EF70|nr:alpha/beta hydrolase [Carboxylicivirga sp. M1479]TRX71271.1 alpha/beta hydrolase [Carboxylicivirga sp. M1479]